MAEHRAARRRVSLRLRAALALGGLGVFFIGGTFAFWADSVTIGGGSFTSGTLDLKVSGADSYATTTLAMTGMVPGSSSAEVVSVQNAGTVPLKYSITAGLTGTDAAAYGTATSLRLTLVKDGSRAGSGSSATCTGGTALASSVALTTTTTTVILAPQGPIAAAGAVSICVQVALATDAPSTLQGKAATMALTATGSSDLS